MKLTKPQKQIYNMESLMNDSVSCICGSMLLKTEKTVSEMQEAVNVIYRINDALRLRIKKDGKDITQHLIGYEETTVPVLYFNNTSEMYAYANKYAKKPISLEGKLWEITVLKLPEYSGILVKFHHIIADSWTAALICSQFKLLINDKIPDVYSYTDYLTSENEYLNSKRYIKDKEYFTAKMNECSEPVFISDKADISFVAERKTFRIEETKLLKSFCEKQNYSVFTFFLSVASFYLSRITHNSDNFFIGTTVLNRTGEKERNTVGMYVNTVPVLVQPDYNTTVNNNILEINTEIFSVLRHQKFNYTDILEDTGKGKLFDILVSYQNAQILDGDVLSQWHHNGIQAESLQIHIEDRDSDGTLKIHYDYRTDKFTADEIDTMHSHIFNLLYDCMENPDKKISELNMLSDSEKQKILIDFNDTSVEYSSKKCVHTLFEEQAEKNPDKTAIVSCDNILTYKELNEKANSIANALIKKGICKGDIVAFRLPRNSFLVASMLGILKTGAAYLPVDPDYPENRISYMLIDSGAKYCITEENINELLDNNITSPAIKVNSSDICYCIYTSGSTGKPKGTLITHKNVVNYITANEKNICYGITKTAKSILSVTTAGFDIFVTETLLPLANGMHIVLANEEQARLQRKLIELLKSNPCDILQTTPTKMKTLMTDKNNLDYLKGFGTIILGGEMLESSLVNELKNITNAEIYNIYGPTEATVWVTFSKIEDTENITIGKPMANTQIHIVDKHMNLVPVGVKGELCIAGDCVAKGYLNRDELTDENFIDNPFGEGKLYKTGDNAYWNKDGNIVFAGRNDFQVKIRGMRIELGEIENAVSEIDGINLSVAVVRKDKQGRQFICVFYTGEEKTAKEIKDIIGVKLPKYMIPHIFTHLTEMPLTSSGKINRKILPDIDLEDIETQAEFVVPETEQETAVAECISAVLGNEKISVLDNFFDIGGDSLKAIGLSAKLESNGYEISVRDIFDSKDIRELAKKLTKNECKYEKVEYGNILPATQAQMRIYTSQYINPDSAHYNIPYVFRVRELDVSRFENAVNKLIERHESLRTRFINKNGQVMQIIEDNAEITVQNLSGNDISVFNTPFDIEKAPLFRAGYYENTVFIITHHIVADGETMTVLLKELNELYMGRELPEAVQYGEFAVTDGYTKENEDYWLSVFDEEIDSINLKKDFVKPEKKSFEGKQIYELIKTHDLITEKCKELSITPYVYYMACYSILLSKYSSNEDIITAMPVSGRTNRFLNTAGMFVNMVALRTKPDGNKTIIDFFKEVKDNSIRATENQNYPIGKLIRKLNLDITSRNPLTDIMFAYQSKQTTNIIFGDSQAEILPVALAGVKCDLCLTIMPRENDTVLMVEYSTDLFKEQTITEFIASYKVILEATLDETKCIKEISALSYDENNRLNAFNDTYHRYPIQNNATIFSLFEKTAKENINKVCIKTAERNLTFGELLSVSENIDSEIRKITNGKKSVIAVISERSCEMYSAIYGIIRGGNAYLPIDPAYPEDRIKYILRNSNASAVVAQCKFTRLASDVPCIDITEFLHNNIQKSENILPCCSNENDTAYVIYTSGSTGNPKGAAVSHKSAVNRIMWMHDKYPLGEDDVILQKTPYTFDVSVWEIFWLGIHSGCLAVSKPGEHFIPEKILEETQRNRVTHIHFVPSVFELFLNYLESHTQETEKFDSVKYVFLSGEALSASLVQRFYKLFNYGKVKLNNLYGPTECAIDVTYYDCNPKDTAPVPIGRPIYNTQMHIVDKHMHLVPVGVQGEICIAGMNVGQGYLNNETLTNEKFIKNPFGEGKLYKTGDLGYWRDDGNIIFVGRNDFQVKIRGLRIELGEIENAVSEIEGIDLSVAVVSEDKQERLFICVYYTGKEKNTKEIKNHISEKLPKYMVPHIFIHLNEMPLTSSGKINRKALPMTEVNFTDSSDHEKPVNETEKLICNTFSEILSTENVGRNTDFFEIGGTSLSMISLLSKKAFKEISAADFLRNSTPKKLAVLMNSIKTDRTEYLEPLYISKKSEKALILLPFAGGGAEAFSRFTNEIKHVNDEISIYFIRFLHSEYDCEKATTEIKKVLSGKEVTIYSHCAGAAVAMNILGNLETKGFCVNHYFAGAFIPQKKPSAKNIWNSTPDFILSNILNKSGAKLDKMSKNTQKQILMQFRKDTDFATLVFYKFRKKLKTPVTVIISQKDVFTRNYNDAHKCWSRYAENVKKVKFIDTESHYFQSDNADELANSISL